MKWFRSGGIQSNPINPAGPFFAACPRRRSQTVVTAVLRQIAASPRCLIQMRTAGEVARGIRREDW